MKVFLRRVPVVDSCNHHLPAVRRNDLIGRTGMFGHIRVFTDDFALLKWMRLPPCFRVTEGSTESVRVRQFRIALIFVIGMCVVGWIDVKQHRVIARYRLARILKTAHLFFKSSRRRPVVRVPMRDDFPSCHPTTLIPLFRDRFFSVDAKITNAVNVGPIAQFKGWLLRIVKNNELFLGVGLTQEAIQRGHCPLTPAAARDNTTDQFHAAIGLIDQSTAIPSLSQRILASGFHLPRLIALQMY